MEPRDFLVAALLLPCGMTRRTLNRTVLDRGRHSPRITLSPSNRRKQGDTCALTFVCFFSYLQGKVPFGFRVTHPPLREGMMGGFALNLQQSLDSTQEQEAEMRGRGKRAFGTWEASAYSPSERQLFCASCASSQCLRRNGVVMGFRGRRV